MDLASYSTAGFDRGASRAKEILWYVVKTLVFLSSVPFPSRLKSWILRRFGAQVGIGLVIRPRVNVTFPWRLVVGDHVWIGEDTTILSLAPVRIGSNVCISQRVFLCTGSHDYRSPRFDLITKPIRIGSGSWIAAQVFVGPGVSVGSGAIVAAGAVVVSDVPTDVIVRGNPAMAVKTIVRPVSDNLLGARATDESKAASEHSGRVVQGGAP